MPQDWIPGLKQADCVSVELRQKNQWSEKYAAVMRDGSEYWLDRTTSMLKRGLGNGEGLLWWRGDMSLVGAYEAIMVSAKVDNQDNWDRIQTLDKKQSEWASAQLGADSLAEAAVTLKTTRFGLIKLLHGARMRYKAASAKACELGTRAHQLCEVWLKNGGNLDFDLGTGEILEYDIEAEEPEVQSAFRAFCKWFEGAGLTHKVSELLIYDLDAGVAGRTDHILTRNDNGNAHMVDLKTSKGFYPEMLLQVAGYCGMAQKCGHGLCQTADIIRIDKITAEFAVMPVFEDMDQFRSLYAQFRGVVRTARFMDWADSYTAKYNRAAKK